MNRLSLIVSAGMSGCLILLLLGSAVSDEPTSNRTAKDKSATRRRQASISKADHIPRMSPALARDRAELLHEVYASTLAVMHERYFHGDRAMVPARVMEDVFADIKQESQIEARWIAVSLKAMSINHEAKSDFEKHAAREIKLGKREVERVEDGYYRRAAAISLSGGCIHCHESSFRQSSPSSKFAGLVISIPIAEDSDMTTPPRTK